MEAADAVYLKRGIYTCAGGGDVGSAQTIRSHRRGDMPTFSKQCSMEAARCRCCFAGLGVMMVG